MDFSDFKENVHITLCIRIQETEHKPVGAEEVKITHTAVAVQLFHLLQVRDMNYVNKQYSEGYILNNLPCWYLEVLVPLNR